MHFLRYTLLIALLLSAGLCHAQIPAGLPQLLAGKRVAIDPGHGGRDSDDRETPLGNGYTYWESDGVWEMGLQLQAILNALGATTKLTRTTNDPASPYRDPSLSERVAVANAFSADYMHSIHTNAGGGSANYTLMLYRGVNGVPTWSGAKRMGGIMAPLFYQYMYTTTYYNRADRDFLPYYLGVLSGTNMPATLSEGSFHDNLPEGKRLMGSTYRKAAVWAMVKSFLQYYGVGSLPYGDGGGLVKDQNGTPVKGVTCRLTGNGYDKTLLTDYADGGYYFFDWLPAGAYTLTLSKVGFDTKSVAVNITAGQHTRLDVSMNSQGSCSISHNATYEWLQRFVFGSYTNNSGSNKGYGNFTTGTPISGVSAGGTYTVQLTPGFASTVYKERWKVWIDLNGNGNLSDPGEELLDQYTTTSGVLSASITIPASAQPGRRLLRVGMNGTSSDYTLTPCNAFGYGEVEDYLVDIGASGCTPPAITSILIDQEATSRYVETGSWTASTSQPGYEGSGYRHDGNTGKGQKSIRYTPTIQQAGTYTVYVKHTAFSNRATNVPVTITHQNGSTTVTVNQQVNDGWNSVGTYTFVTGTAGYVDISNTGTNGYVVADAVRFDFQTCSSSGARLSQPLAVSVQPEVEGYVLYPNPVASDKVSLGLPAQAQGQVLQIACYNLAGQLLKSWNLQVTQGQQQQEISLQGIPQGIYLLRLRQADGGQHTLRLLRQ